MRIKLGFGILAGAGAMMASLSSLPEGPLEKQEGSLLANLGMRLSAACENAAPFYRAGAGKYVIHHDMSAKQQEQLRSKPIFWNKGQGKNLEDEDFRFLPKEEWTEFTKGYDKIVTVSIIGAQGAGKSTSLNILFFADERSAKNGSVPVNITPFETSRNVRCTQGMTAVLIPMPRDFLPPRFSADVPPDSMLDDDISGLPATASDGKEKIGLMLVDVEGLFSRQDHNSTRGCAMLMRVWSLSNVIIHLFDNPDANNFNFISATFHLLRTNPALNSMYNSKPSNYKPHFIGYWVGARRDEEIRSFSDYAKWFPGGRVPDEINGPQFCWSPRHKVDDILTEEYHVHGDASRPVTLNPHDMRHRLKEYVMTQTEAAPRSPAELFAVMYEWDSDAFRKVASVASFGFQPCSAECKVCHIRCLESAAVPHAHGNILDSCTDTNAKKVRVCARHRAEPLEREDAMKARLYSVVWGESFCCRRCELEKGVSRSHDPVYEKVLNWMYWPVENPDFLKRFPEVGVHQFEESSDHARDGERTA